MFLLNGLTDTDFTSIFFDFAVADVHTVYVENYKTPAVIFD